jgi:hypothetical protein
MKPGTYQAQITRRVVRYPESARDRFRSLGEAWDASGRKKWSAWKEFEALARAPGCAFETYDCSGFFAEILVAKELHDAGYDCWQARKCHLFLKNNREEARRSRRTLLRPSWQRKGRAP